MELRNDPSRRHPVGSPGSKGPSGAVQPPPERIRSELAAAKEAHEAQLRATIERVGATVRESASSVRINASSDAGDSVEFSRLAQQVAENDAMQNERRDQLVALRRAHESGTLNTRERVERAAERLLARD